MNSITLAQPSELVSHDPKVGHRFILNGPKSVWSKKLFYWCIAQPLKTQTATGNENNLKMFNNV